MALPDISMRELLEAGAHFGHQTHRWNPAWLPTCSGVRNDIHILDLAQDRCPCCSAALQDAARHRRPAERPRAVRRHQAPGAGGRSPRSQALGQYFVNQRWLGGMLTNWNTISASIQTPAQARRTS
jgi:small subunit ribosomal protein S2